MGTNESNDNTNAATLDPVAVLEGLDPAAIEGRLKELGREQKALRVLLRAARARRRQEDRKAVCHAD